MPDVHLINPMRNPAGGSEHRTIGLFEILGETNLVQVWTEEDPHPAFMGRVPMRKIGPPDRFPKGGNLVFAGTYFSIGGWIQAAKPNRIILIQNLDQPDRLRQVVSSLSAMDLPRPEVTYASQSIAKMTPEFPGPVHESPIDLERFSPLPKQEDRFVVGRLSRDVPDKHGLGDAVVYRRLAEAGIKVIQDRCLMVDHRRLCG